MSFEDNHNHFCIYCGARLIPNQHFCSQCGKKVYQDPKPKLVRSPSKYEAIVNDIEKDYNSKEAKASELVGKLFNPTHVLF